jgi:RNA polymerase sigma factor (sigma-70 family)
MSGWIDDLRDMRDGLVGFVRRRLGDDALQDAEDIVQDVLVGLFDRADPTVPIRDLAAYLYRALRNRIVDRFRRRRDTLPLIEEILSSGADPSREYERRESLEAMFAAMDKLAPEEKAVILATEFDGRAFKELAEEWNVPLGTLLARKSRALDKLSNQLTGQNKSTHKENTHEHPCKNG